MEREKIVIGITQGDINGIGYEVILKTLSESRVLDAFVPVIYGSPKVAAFHRKQLDIQGINLNIINSVEELNPKRINIINCSDDEIKVELGRSTVEAGKAAFAALEQATEDLKKGALDAIVTAPINKKNIQSADFHFPGHTEYLEEKYGLSAGYAGLLHDAAEAYINDLATPLKRHLKEFNEVEDAIMAAVMRKFKIDPLCMTYVHEGDQILFLTEAKELMGNPQWESVRLFRDQGLRPLDWTFREVSPAEVREKFLLKFHRYQEDLSL